MGFVTEEGGGGGRERGGTRRWEEEGKEGQKPSSNMKERCKSKIYRGNRCRESWGDKKSEDGRVRAWVVGLFSFSF